MGKRPETGQGGVKGSLARWRTINAGSEIDMLENEISLPKDCLVAELVVYSTPAQESNHK